MNNCELQRALEAVPQGTFLIERRTPGSGVRSGRDGRQAEAAGGGSGEADWSGCRCLSADQLAAKTGGKGLIEIASVFAGAEISRHRYLADNVSFHHREAACVLEINHCRRGRIGWEMRGGESVYLGEGDVCIHSMKSCADSRMRLPLGYYEGLAVAVDLRELEKNCPAILKEAGFNARLIFEKFCAGGRPLGIAASEETERIFAGLYELPPEMTGAYYKIKVVELLLFLMRLEPEKEGRLTGYVSEQTETIRRIRDQLVSDLGRRTTIEELSRQYLLNTSTLKSVFKAVYGVPIATYVRECRMREAERLLLQTDDSIALIAEKVGYGTQGKFAQAFREKENLLPSEYRKRYKERARTGGKT